ncbi:MAG: radical SAM protein [Candidatus Aenigmarchaeota archaeon]|nr:radical SAM protein [Candidatus Aenigmarchaeota archaeon]
MVWPLVRFDAINSLEYHLVKKILPRYVKVAKNELPAKFQITKRISCIGINDEKTLTEDELWELHMKATKEFYKVVKKIDEKKLKLEDLKIPKFSLLDLKILLTKIIMKSCELCERKCGVNRLENKKGFCKVANECLISSEFIHMGEEFYIIPSHTIFFMGCTLQCQFCQNYTISQWYERGEKILPEDLALMIEMRRNGGARNVNFVGGEPTPSLLWILEALKKCKVNIPTIWNSNFYMSEKTMKILDGVVDMHLSDFKYGKNECALRLSKIPKYFDIVARNHKMASLTTEMTIRHLVLPNHVNCCTKPVLEWIANNLRNKVIVNVMEQFRPEFKAHEYPEINRCVSKKEMEEAIDFAKELKLNFIT